MELFTLSLTQNVPYTIPAVGRWFRVLIGSGDFQIRTSAGHESKYVAGLGIELPAFETLTITSLDKDQQIRCAISPFNIDDSRLIGEIATTFSVDSSTIAATSSGQLFPINISRKSITVAVDQGVYLCDYTPADTNGFYMGAGSAVFENSGELYAYNPNGTVCNVSILEESY